MIRALGFILAAGMVAVSAHAATDAMAAAVPAADMKKIERCHAMKPDAMAKSAMCAKMMKMYPDRFGVGSASTN